MKGPSTQGPLFRASSLAFQPSALGLRLEGEVPQFHGEKLERILKVLKEKGVEWRDDSEPVALKTRTESGTTGFLETMSLLLTGSLLHLQLLKGDSGGPLVVRYGGTAFVSGLDSYHQPEGCAVKPNGFTKASAFSAWIQSTIANWG
ncbi:unnamed protein product [Darwinula stevensoni]|uniref:Peptidase S1 domain-containing protein n=1 Tax=Darwinula stevensoni TaxID=69355 RepID=A0A7R9ACS4_9CRUS|nr:unnamed protein product [Darwinula stevensoni]CAG0900106.1 unnamed protein product [Darwinula stevensoni]